MLSKIYKILRFLVILSPFILLVSLIYKDIVPSGTVSFRYNIYKDSPVITSLFPEDRLSEPVKINKGEYYQEIIKEPVYFETRLSQKFEKAEVEVEFQNPESSLFQLGLSAIGEIDWNYTFQPLDNKFINELSWSRIEDNNRSLWQRNTKYTSIDSFLDNFNEEKGIEVYNYDVKRKFKINDYQPSTDFQIINNTIRGYHAFYTYIKNEDLDFTFKIQDINRKEGSDILMVNVYNSKDEKIYTKRIEDDGYLSNLDPASKPRYVSLKLGNLAEGAYRVELDCEDEIFIREIKTKQKYITFIGRLYLVDNLEYADGFIDLNYQPTEVIGNSKRIAFETAHPEGLQEISINNQKIKLEETHKKYYLTVNNLPMKIFIPENDIKIFGNGLFSLNQDNFFNPEIYNLQDFHETPDVNFLLAGYKIPQENNSWFKAKQTFDLDEALIENRKLRWMLSAPEANDLENTIRIKSVKITYFKAPLAWEDLLPKITEYLKRYLFYGK